MQQFLLTYDLQKNYSNVFLISVILAVVLVVSAGIVLIACICKVQKQKQQCAQVKQNSLLQSKFSVGVSITSLSVASISISKHIVRGDLKNMPTPANWAQYSTRCDKRIERHSIYASNGTEV